MDIEKQKKHLQHLIEDSLSNIKYQTSSLWTKHWENDIKYNKLVLLRLNIIDTITYEVNKKIAAKIKQCLFDSMETLEEMVDAGELDENLYLESVNDLKRLFNENEKNFDFE